MIPKPIDLEFSELKCWLERARNVRDHAYAEAREVAGDQINQLDNEELLELALELPEEDGVSVLQYVSARLWQEKLVAHRLERNVLNLNGNGALIERYWNVANPPFSQMQRVYETQKARYDLAPKE